MTQSPAHPDVFHAVTAAMRSFEAAERELDAERLLAHFSHEPDVFIYNDGQRVPYAAMAGAVRGTFPTLKSIEGGFSNVDVIVLAPEAALAAAAFEETVLDRAGRTVRQRGIASWLWRKIDGQWRIIYGQVDHYSS